MPDFTPVLLVFSRSKHGKTVDCVASLPKSLFIADRNALLSAKTVLNYVPTNIPTAKTYLDVTGILSSKVVEKYDSIVIDDVTLLGRDTERWLHENEPGAKGQNMYNYLVDATLAMLQAAKQTGKVVVVNGHERPARTNHAGKYIRGGIDLPCDLTEAFTARSDGAFRGVPCEPGDALRPAHPHPFIYCSPSMDNTWATGNRIGAAEIAPANIGELLRATGVYDPPRPDNLKWQDDVVAKVFEKLKTAEKKEVLPKALEQLKAKDFPVAHIMWALRDAEDRHTIWVQNQKNVQQFNL